MSASRYENLPTRTWTAPDGRRLPYLERRLLPGPGAFPATRAARVVAGERCDTLAARELGDAQLSWLLADANLAMRPSELERTNATVAIPVPEGVAMRVDGQ